MSLIPSPECLYALDVMVSGEREGNVHSPNPRDLWMKSPSTHARVDRSSLLAIAWSLVIAACLLVFVPYLANTNLPKELLWWTALPMMIGVWMVIATDSDRTRSKTIATGMIRRHRGLAILCSAWIAWCVFAAWTAPDSSRALVLLGRQIGFLLTAASAAIVFSNTRALATLLEILATVLALIGAYTVLQFVGIDFVPWTETRRPPGTFGNPNFTANLLACLLPLSIVWESCLRPAGSTKQAESDSSQPTVRPLGFPFRSLVSLFGLLATQSRGGLIALGVGMTCLAVLLIPVRRRRADDGTANPRTSSRSVIRRVLVVTLVIEVLFAGLYWSAPHRLEHFMSSSTLELRRELWTGSWLLWKDAPILGHGLGSFQTVSPRIAYLFEPIAANKQALHAHSWIVELFVEHGLFGAFLFLVLLGRLLFVLLQGAVRAARPEVRLLVIATLSGILALLAGTSVGVWLNWWGGEWMLSMLAGLGIGLTLADLHPAGNAATERLAPKRLPHQVWAVVGSLLILVSLAIGVLGWNFYRSERRFHQARSLIAEGKLAEAVDSLDHAAALVPHSPDLSYWKTFCLLNTGRAEEALSRLNRLVDCRPWDARSQYLLGEAHRLLGRPDLAAEAFQRTYALETTGRMAVEWANALLAQGKVAEARGILERQLQRAIHPPALRLYLQIQKETGELAAARDFIHRLRNDDSLYFRKEDRAALARWEAELSTLLGDRVGAAVAYEDALLLEADDFQLWNDYGLALKRIRQLDRADAAFARASQLNPAHYAPLTNRLELAIDRNKPVLARKLAEQLRGIPVPNEVRERLNQLERELSQPDPQTPDR